MVCDLYWTSLRGRCMKHTLLIRAVKSSIVPILAVKLAELPTALRCHPGDANLVLPEAKGQYELHAA